MAILDAVLRLYNTPEAYEQTQDFIRRGVGHRLRPFSPDFEDAVADANLRLLEIQNPSTDVRPGLIITIGSHAATDILRRQQRRNRHGTEWSIFPEEQNEEGLALVSEGADFSPQSDLRFEVQAMISGFNNLDPDQCNVIKLRVQELNYDEIAQLLGIPSKTVKRRLNRARNNLRQQFPDYRQLY